MGRADDVEDGGPVRCAGAGSVSVWVVGDARRMARRRTDGYICGFELPVQQAWPGRCSDDDLLLADWDTGQR